MVIATVALVLVSPGNLTLSSLGFSRAAPSDGGDLSAQTRLYIWRDVVPMILERPLLGHGSDNFREPIRPYVSEDLEGLVTNGRGEIRGLDRAHNHPLQIAATAGFLGLAAYLWLLVSLFRNAVKRGGWFLTILLGAVLAYVLRLLTAFPSVATDVAFWSILGASVAVVRTHKEEDGGPVEETDESALPRTSEREGRAELLAGAVVVAVLVAIAVPTFLQQRERSAEMNRTESTLNAFQVVNSYNRLGQLGSYPEDGVYSNENPTRNAGGRAVFRPSEGVVTTTRTAPEGGFVVDARSTTLAGTSESSYDSARPTAPTVVRKS